MRTGFPTSSLVPRGLAVESVSDSSDSIIFAVRLRAGMAECPLCGVASRRINSRYSRQVADLPSAGRHIRLRVIARWFVCEVRNCRRQIFAERFGDEVLPVRSLRTARLECIVQYLGLELGGRPAAAFGKRLILPVSNYTLLKVVRRRTCPRTESLTAIDIDDWPSGRTIAMERSCAIWSGGRIVALLPVRENATVQAWLFKYAGVKRAAAEAAIARRARRAVRCKLKKQTGACCSA